jgi:6-phosphogluconolactonase
MVGALWLASASAALATSAFTQVGAPVATGSNPTAGAFSPNGELFVTTNFNASTVSVFAVAAGGALTPVSGSPFAAGTGPASVAFSPSGGLLATARLATGTVP